MDATPRNQHRFWLGLIAGVTCGLGVICLPLLWLGGAGAAEMWATVPALGARLQQLAIHNLRGAVLPFSIVLTYYCGQLLLLSRELDSERPQLHSVVRREQLLDLSANLFFGIGVIWTAVGMRDALLHSLGDPSAAATAGAFAVLQRLVDGGILLALSTTIVGGIGGYLMRVLKSLSLGERITEVYLAASEEPQRAGLQGLARIEALLSRREAGADREPAGTAEP